jgi:Methyltransferase domain
MVRGLLMDQAQRVALATRNLKLDQPGLEVSPLYRPLVKRPNNVFYTDYCSAEESRRKHASYEHDPIMEIDFIWVPGRRLIDCVGHGTKFDWAISSHVMEHVPDPIGWLAQVFEVLNEGATFSLVLPHKQYCFDKFRNNTDAAMLVDAWIRSNSVPSPYQLFDFLSRSIEMSGADAVKLLETTLEFKNAKRHYTDADALNFVTHSWTTGGYIDAHCSVFKPDSFVAVFNQINDLKILNIEISEPEVGRDEFFVEIRKLGEPEFRHPGPEFGSDIKVHQDMTRLQADLDHARAAFVEAVSVQNHLKESAVKLQNRMNTEVALRPVMKPWVPSFLKRILTR